MDEKHRFDRAEERALLRRLVRGEESAFRELVERLEVPLVRFAERFLGDRSAAEDIFQETFVRVVRNIRDFKPKAALTTWIFTIARNLCLDRLKKIRRHREVSLDAPQRDEGGKIIDFREVLRRRETSPIELSQQHEEERRLRGALARLSDSKRESLVLRVHAGLSYAEIAEVLDSPVGTIKFRVHEAVRELASMLEGESPVSETGSE